MDLIHGAGGLRRARLAHDPGRNASRSLVRRHVVEHDRPRRDQRAGADFDIAENLRARADQHAAPDFGVALAAAFAGAPQRDPVQHRHVILDDGCRADYNACGVVKEESAPDLRRGMDVGLENLRRK